jgi:hypothetical protein
MAVKKSRAGTQSSCRVGKQRMSKQGSKWLQSRGNRRVPGQVSRVVAGQASRVAAEQGRRIAVGQRGRVAAGSVSDLPSFHMDPDLRTRPAVTLNMNISTFLNLSYLRRRLHAFIDEKQGKIPKIV